MKIYLIFEIGAGIIHGAFYNMEDALAKIEILKEQSGYDCFEIIPTIIS